MKQLHTVFRRLAEDIRRTKFALGILLLYLIMSQAIFHTACPFALLFGFPCPACGLTRAGLLLLSGQFAAAFAINAAICLWVPFLLYLIVFRYFLGKRPPLAMMLSISVCLMTVLLYLLRLTQGDLVAIPCEGLLPKLLSGFRQ